MNINECEAAGVDPIELQKVVKSLERSCRKLSEMGLYIFGSGEGSVRKCDDNGDLVLCEINGCRIEGGAGDTNHDFDGLTRGEI